MTFQVLPRVPVFVNIAFGSRSLEEPFLRHLFLFLALFPFLTLCERSCLGWCPGCAVPGLLWHQRWDSCLLYRALTLPCIPPSLAWSCLSPTPVPAARSTCPNVHPCPAFLSDVFQVTTSGWENVSNTTLHLERGSG